MINTIIHMLPNLINFSMLINIGIIFCAALFVLQRISGRIFYQVIGRFLFLLVVSAVLLFIKGEFFLFRHVSLLLAIGVGMGWLMSGLFISKPSEALFRQFVLETLKNYQSYFLNMMQEKKQQKNNIEQVWLHWPFWANHLHFDFKFRLGFNFFLQKLSQMSDVLFSLNYLSTRLQEQDSWSLLKNYFASCEKEFNQIFSEIICAVDEVRSLTDVLNMENSLTMLENQFRNLFPVSLEALDIQPNAIIAASFICSLEDLYWLLLKLAQSLRE